MEYKTCSFYISECHLIVMILPYLRKKFENNEEVEIVSQKNLREIVNNLLEKLNIDEKQKQKIKKLNWDKNETINKKVINTKNVVVIGNEEYIDSINLLINKNCKIINCYEASNDNKKTEEILKNYEKILNTSGENVIIR